MKSWLDKAKYVRNIVETKQELIGREWVGNRSGPQERPCEVMVGTKPEWVRDRSEIGRNRSGPEERPCEVKLGTQQD